MLFVSDLHPENWHSVAQLEAWLTVDLHKERQAQPDLRLPRLSAASHIPWLYS